MIIVIPHIIVRGANMLQTPSLIAPVPVFASHMMAEAMRHAGVFDSAYETALIIHKAKPEVEFQPSEIGGLGFELHNKRGACGYFVSNGSKGSGNGGDYASGSKGPSGMSYQPHAICDLDISLLIRTDDENVDGQSVAKFFRHARLAGGVIDSHHEINYFDSLRSASEALPSGFFITDASRAAQLRLDDGEHVAHAVMGRMDYDKHPNIERGWYVPATVGYATLTAFSNLEGARDGLLAAFAEPVVGLVRLRSVQSLKNAFSSDDGNPFPVFWQHGWVTDNDSNVFLLSTERFNHP